MSTVARHYHRHAERLARAYRDVSFETVHSPLLKYLPPLGSRIIDIGAGAGRDAYALAEQGYDVTAVEPSAEMRRVGQREENDAQVTWLDDSLPALMSVRATGETFRFILCSAVLMHLPGRLLVASFEAMHAIAEYDALLAVTVRNPLPSDPSGVFHHHGRKTIVNAAAKAGFALFKDGTNGDVLRRSDVNWSWFIFRATSQSRSLPRLRSESSSAVP